MANFCVNIMGFNEIDRPNAETVCLYVDGCAGDYMLAAIGCMAFLMEYVPGYSGGALAELADAFIHTGWQDISNNYARQYLCAGSNSVFWPDSGQRPDSVAG